MPAALQAAADWVERPAQFEAAYEPGRALGRDDAVALASGAIAG